MQTIRVGTLNFDGVEKRTLMTSIQKDLETTLHALKLSKLFSSPPTWIGAQL